MENKTDICDLCIIHKENIKRAKKLSLDDDKLMLIADFYKALSDSTRIRIINALSVGELCVCDIAKLLNMTKSAVSHQLRYLREMDIVKNRKEGKEVFYVLSDEHVKTIFTLTAIHLGECRNEN